MIRRGVCKICDEKTTFPSHVYCKHHGSKIFEEYCYICKGYTGFNRREEIIYIDAPIYKTGIIGSGPRWSPLSMPTYFEHYCKKCDMSKSKFKQRLKPAPANETISKILFISFGIGLLLFIPSFWTDFFISWAFTLTFGSSTVGLLYALSLISEEDFQKNWSNVELMKHSTGHYEGEFELRGVYFESGEKLVVRRKLHHLMKKFPI